jgi:hypothetical protein
LSENTGFYKSDSGDSVTKNPGFWPGTGIPTGISPVEKGVFFPMGLTFLHALLLTGGSFLAGTF